MGKKQLVFSDSHSVTTAVQDGTDGVADTDYDETPPNGSIVIGNDGADDCIYVRVGGAWKKVALA